GSRPQGRSPTKRLPLIRIVVSSRGCSLDGANEMPSSVPTSDQVHDVPPVFARRLLGKEGVWPMAPPEREGPDVEVPPSGVGERSWPKCGDYEITQACL